MTETSEERAARSIEDIFARGVPGGWINGRYVSPVEMRRNAIVSVIESCISGSNRVLQAENAALAADQCHSGYGDEYGNHRCKEVDSRDVEIAGLRADLACASLLADNIADSQYCAGAKFGWNCGAEDDHGRFQQMIEQRARSREDWKEEIAAARIRKSSRDAETAKLRAAESGSNVAPDLVTALKEWIEMCSGFSDFETSRRAHLVLLDRIRRSRDAIARAEGRAPASDLL